MHNAAIEPAVAVMVASRGNSAELKLKLISLRQETPNSMVFVFEGDDDRSVYFSWVRYLEAGFSYEPFTCNGKGAVLKLKEAVSRDAGDLATGVYFFIDQDFDGSRGVPDDGRLYVTDAYSVENYLVNDEVLEEILKIEFHCHAAPLVRRRVIDLFRDVYAQFLQASKDVNRDLHAARSLGVQLQDDLPKGVSSFVIIDLNNVTRSDTPSSSVVRTTREISDEEKAGLLHEFESLDPAMRYRGKFALSFFMQWMERLATERKAQNTDLFHGLDPAVRVLNGRLSMATLASRSAPPPSFRIFFDVIRRQMVEAEA